MRQNCWLSAPAPHLSSYAPTGIWTSTRKVRRSSWLSATSIPTTGASPPKHMPLQEYGKVPERWDRVLGCLLHVTPQAYAPTGIWKSTWEVRQSPWLSATTSPPKLMLLLEYGKVPERWDRVLGCLLPAPPLPLPSSRRPPRLFHSWINWLSITSHNMHCLILSYKQWWASYFYKVTGLCYFRYW